MQTLAHNKTVALGRMLFLDKKNYTRDQLKIESTGPYQLEEKDDCFVIHNTDCCKAILVTVQAE